MPRNWPIPTPLFWVAPIIGGIVGAVAYRLISPDEPAPEIIGRGRDNASGEPMFARATSYLTNEVTAGVGVSYLVILIPIALKLSIALTVFAIGLRANPKDLTLLIRKPGLLVRSLVSMSLVMPLVALALVTCIDMKAPVAIALATLSLSPIPPMLPRKELNAGAGAPYVFSLLVTVAALAVAQMPVGVDLIGRLLGHPARISPVVVAQIMAVAVLAPLAGGMLVHVLAPALADQFARRLSAIGTILLVVCALPVLVLEAPLAWSLIGDGTVLAIGTFIVAGLAAGHILGGPAPSDRVVLALSTASRHPGVALAVAIDNAPDHKRVIAAIIVYLLLNAILSSGYLAWARPREAIHVGEAA